jgi:hypothetical protein
MEIGACALFEFLDIHLQVTPWLQPGGLLIGKSSAVSTAFTFRAKSR